MEADANEVKVEAMAQRSLDVHRMITRGSTPQGGSIEEFIDRLEQEEVRKARRRGTARLVAPGTAIPRNSRL